jgi:RNA methyltransferase, TrmH family
MNETITSRQNPWFKRIQRAMREHADEIVVEGTKQVDDAIRAGWKPLAVVRAQSAERGAQENEIQFTAKLFDAVADTKTSQGVLALFSRPRYTLSDVLSRRDTVAVALDGVQDPGNVGTIVRLAAAFDASGVLLLPGCADAYSPKAIRASVGAALSVPIASATLDELRAFSPRERGEGARSADEGPSPGLRPPSPARAGEGTLTMLYADGSGSPIDPPAKNAIFVFGSEGQGVSDPIRRAAKPIAIAMSDRVESLNVAAAAAILLSRSYEARH